MWIRCRALGPALLVVLPLARGTVGAAAETVDAASPRTIEWFQATEQALMDAVATGDRSAWERVLDPSCVLTSEEGEVMTRPQFLDALRPLPKGLTGGIAVRELTIQEFPTFAVVRYLADEWESVFGQKLSTRYRVTDTFRRDGEAWKMVASQVAVVTQDPPAQTASRRVDLRHREGRREPHPELPEVRAARVDARRRFLSAALTVAEG